jgi:hypothetical protein
MNFDPSNCHLKIWDSIGTPTLKVGAHLEVLGSIPSHFFTLSETKNVTQIVCQLPILYVNWIDSFSILICYYEI